MMEPSDQYSQYNYTKTGHPGHESRVAASMGYEAVLPRSGGRRVVGGRSRFRNQLMVIVLLVLSFGVMVTIVNIYQLHLIQNDSGRPLPEGRTEMDARRPVAWVSGKRLNSGYLRHVFTVLDRIGYVTGDENSDWELLWSHDYPFMTYKEILSNLKPHQKVNHFPGSGFLTNKLNLVSGSSKLEFVPKAFRLPNEKDRFVTYAYAHQDKKWIQKSNNHRGIQIKAVQDLDLDKEGTFVQEFVDDPYLIDGRRFDIGIYTAITSINPLRLYVFEGDWLIRFCPEPFYPFDDKVVHKYVVTDDYMPPWELPSLKRYYEELSYNRKDSLFGHMKSEGLDTEALARRIYSAIRRTVLSKESYFVQATTNSFPTSKNFFEMVRFDFVLDKKLNVYLMEVNMSPNLSSGHFPPNRLLYEQVIYSLFGLVGLARPTHYDITRGSSDEKEMQVSTRNIHVFAELCGSSKCRDNCRSLECKLCHDCLKADQIDTMERAVLEHHNKKYWMRIFPEPFASQKEARNWTYVKDAKFSHLTTANQWMTVWYQGKCIQDPIWCL